MFIDNIDLKGNPFFLSDEDIKWVHSTLERMSDEDKLGQLFCISSREGNPTEIEEFLQILKPGGIMLRPMGLEKIAIYKRLLDDKLDIPMLFSANLETGGRGIAEEGTLFASPLQAAATGKDAVLMAERLGTICGREGAALGANWSYAPIIDIDYNFRNPITNTRTFGSDPERVKEMGVAYLKALQKHGIAAAAKHFPGDGRDERDQHLVTTINDMECEEWDETYGAAYRAVIDAGVLSIMTGHIMLPSYQRRLAPDLRDDEFMPATLSQELTQDLLRGLLGFNGLIVSDAMTMCGFCIAMPRPEAIPLSIERGADIFLFTKNLAEDYSFMVEGYKKGLLSEKRLNDAVTRILAMKAALGLHRKRHDIDPEAVRKVLGREEHKAWARDCADKSITLVKEQAAVLPLTPERYQRVLFCPVEAEKGVVYSVRTGVCALLRDMLIAEGFTVEEFIPSPNLEGNMQLYADFDKYDLILYVANIATKSNQTTVRIEWKQPMGADVPIHIEAIPTVFISVENPYHLLDVPRVKTYINTYNSNDDVLKALLEKLTGRSPFKGVSPVDAFCGKWDTRL